MRTFSKPNYDWTMSYIELGEICEEVYGVPYDLQMGERGQGEYEIVTTGEMHDREGYWRGMSQNDNYHGGEFYYFDEGDSSLDTTDKAIAHWQNQKKTVAYPGASPEFDRPFDKIGDDGEHTFWQPSLETVMTDLARRKEIPEGTYMITIDW